MLLADQLDEARAPRGDVAVRDERLDRRRQARSDGGSRQAEIGQANDLVLAHRNAAEDLRHVFRAADPDDQVFGFPEQPLALHPLGIGRELTQSLDISREPGQPVGGALFAIQKLRLRLAVHRHPLAHAQGRVGEQTLGDRRHLEATGQQSVHGIFAQGSDRHDWPSIRRALGIPQPD